MEIKFYCNSFPSSSSPISLFFQYDTRGKIDVSSIHFLSHVSSMSVYSTMIWWRNFASFCQLIHNPLYATREAKRKVERWLIKFFGINRSSSSLVFRIHTVVQYETIFRLQTRINSSSVRWRNFSLLNLKWSLYRQVLKLQLHSTRSSSIIMRRGDQTFQSVAKINH